MKKTLIVALSALMPVVISCSDITDKELPDGVIGPSTYNNRDGAIRLTQATVNELSSAIASYIVVSGLLTDEVEKVGDNYSKDFDMRSNRIVNPPHGIRSLARLARGVVSKYVTGETSTWQARLFMYEAYAEILTADGWCSGVPLSTLDFEGDWTFRPGLTTDEIYLHSIALLDSADKLATDSISLQSAIRLLKARAQIALGRYADAKQTVQGISEEFRYEMRIAFDGGRERRPDELEYGTFIVFASISDNEGINGLPYRSSNDARTQWTPMINNSGLQSFFPVKYLKTGDSSAFVLSSGIQAKLILAEAAFHENDAQQMITILNTLRTNGLYTVDTTELEGGGEQIDTLWSAGTGGVAGLRPFTQLPASPEDQRKMLFSERAYWLFLTGSRQGDLRRLVRKYGMNREQVYPTGVYTTGGSNGVYGTNISFKLHQDEFRNPLFKGCQNDD